jgi:hypothetical protein
MRKTEVTSLSHVTDARQVPPRWRAPWTQFAARVGLALALFTTLAMGSMPIASASMSTGYRILLVYADGYGSANTLHDVLAAQPGVAAVDRFNGQSYLPTLGQLQAYDLVFTFSNAPYLDGTALGNTLADYQDGGGIVVGNFGSFSSNVAAQFPIQGRWLNGGYSPYVYASTVLSNPVTLGIDDARHPLMQGVTTLNATARLPVSLAAGASQVAAYSDGSSALAFKITSGHAAVGLTAYLGDQPGLFGTGDYAKVVVNALSWLKDTTPPTSTATLQPVPVPNLPPVSFSGTATFETSAGIPVGTIAPIQCWNSRGVVVHIAAADEPGGSGVKNLTYVESGAQSAQNTVPAAQLPVAVTISARGLTTLSYFAVDNANNREAPHSLSIFVGASGFASYTCAAPTPTFTPPSSGIMVISGVATANGFTFPVSARINY